MVGDREFPSRADTIAAVRGYVEDLLLRHGCTDEAIDAAVLCASELATNALLHGDGNIRVQVVPGDPARVSVADRNGAAMPVLRDAPPDADAGRGLLLVSMFADRWGVEPAPDGSGKVVWFEVAAQRAVGSAASQAW